MIAVVPPSRPTICKRFRQKTMMSRHGSDRQAGRTVDDWLALDVGKLSRDNCLSPGSVGTTQWLQDGRVIASIGIRAQRDGFALTYVVGEARIDDWIPIAWRRCRFGGSRPYFQCPGQPGKRCGRRVTKLYLVDLSFRCRVCHGLTYPSQRERAFGRTIRRRQRIRHLLGGRPAWIGARIPRPRGMWRRRYERLLRRFDEENVALDELLLEDLEKSSAGIAGLSGRALLRCFRVHHLDE